MELEEAPTGVPSISGNIPVISKEENNNNVLPNLAQWSGGDGYLPELSGVFYPGMVNTDKMKKTSLTYTITPEQMKAEDRLFEQQIEKERRHTLMLRQARKRKKRANKNRGSVPGTLVPIRAYNSYKTRERGTRIDELRNVDQQVAQRIPEQQPKAPVIINWNDDDDGSVTDPGHHLHQTFIEAITTNIKGLDPPKENEGPSKHNIRAGAGTPWQHGMKEIPSSFVDQISIVGVKKSSFFQLMMTGNLFWLRMFLKGKEQMLLPDKLGGTSLDLDTLKVSTPALCGLSDNIYFNNCSQIIELGKTLMSKDFPHLKVYRCHNKESKKNCNLVSKFRHWTVCEDLKYLDLNGNEAYESAARNTPDILIADTVKKYLEDVNQHDSMIEVMTMIAKILCNHLHVPLRVLKRERSFKDIIKCLVEYCMNKSITFDGTKQLQYSINKMMSKASKWIGGKPMYRKLLQSYLNELFIRRWIEYDPDKPITDLIDDFSGRTMVDISDMSSITKSSFCSDVSENVRGGGGERYNSSSPISSKRSGLYSFRCNEMSDLLLLIVRMRSTKNLGGKIESSSEKMILDEYLLDWFFNKIKEMNLIESQVSNTNLNEGSAKITALENFMLTLALPNTDNEVTDTTTTSDASVATAIHYKWNYIEGDKYGSLESFNGTNHSDMMKHLILDNVDIDKEEKLSDYIKTVDESIQNSLTNLLNNEKCWGPIRVIWGTTSYIRLLLHKFANVLDLYSESCHVIEEIPSFKVILLRGRR